MKALESDPRWNRSSIVTGMSSPARRVPAGAGGDHRAILKHSSCERRQREFLQVRFQRSVERFLLRVRRRGWEKKQGGQS